MEGKVQVARESSWVVSQGSLDSAVAVVLEDSAFVDKRHAILSQSLQQERLVLVPPQVPVPCQITVKFLLGLYHVHSIYILSTARTCELYSLIDICEDPEYVSTVRAWIPAQLNSDSKPEDMLSTNFQVLSAQKCLGDAVTMGDKAEESGSNGNRMEALVSGNQNITERDHQALSCTGKANIDSLTDVDGTLTSDPTGMNVEGHTKSIFSSSDESWVEIKLPGLFEKNSSQNHTNGKQHKLQQGTLGYEGSNNKEVEEVCEYVGSGHVELLDLRKLPGNFPVEADIASVVSSSKGEIVCGRKDATFPVYGQKYNAWQNFYEAEFELLDSDAWAAVTVRLLSLQDKSYLEISQIVFLVSPAPPASSFNTSSIPQSMDKGRHSSFLAMLIPSMMQISRVLQNTSDSTSFEGSQSKSSQQCIVPNSSSSREVAVTAEHFDKSGTWPSQVICPNLTSMKPREEQVTGWPTVCSEMIDGQGSEAAFHGSSVTDGPMEILREEEVDKEASQQTGVGQSEVKDGKSSSQGFQCKVEQEGHMIEILTERFDRLEQLCLRMESCFQSAVENLDRRLRLLEAQKICMPEQGEQKQSLTVYSCDPQNTDKLANEGYCITEEKSPSYGTEVPEQKSIENFISQLEHLSSIRKPGLSLDNALASALSQFSETCETLSANQSANLDVLMHGESPHVETVDEIGKDEKPAPHELSPIKLLLAQAEDGGFQQRGLLCCGETCELIEDASITLGQIGSHIQDEKELFSCFVDRDLTSNLNISDFENIQDLKQEFTQTLPQKLFTLQNEDNCLMVGNFNQLKDEEEAFVSNNDFQKGHAKVNIFTLYIDSDNHDMLSLDNHNVFSSGLESESCLNNDNGDASGNQQGNLYISQEFDTGSKGFLPLDQAADQNQARMQDLSILENSTKVDVEADLFWLGNKSDIVSADFGEVTHEGCSQFPAEFTYVDFLSVEEEEFLSKQAQSSKLCGYNEYDEQETVFPGFEGL